MCVRGCPASPIMERGVASGDVGICSCSTRSDEIKFCSAPESTSAELGSLICPEMSVAGRDKQTREIRDGSGRLLCSTAELARFPEWDKLRHSVQSYRNKCKLWHHTISYVPQG